MIKRYLFILFLVLLHPLSAQEFFSMEGLVENFFNETKKSTKEHEQLWNKDLYGPLLLVNSKTREIYANLPDSNGALKPKGNIFTGTLPNNMNMANTSVHWNGRNWAMIMLPVPPDKYDRINLFAHELFHNAQPALGFSLYNTENNHLDQKEGRIYLRLELEALRKALRAKDTKEINSHLLHAFIFRKYRYQLFPSADSTENLLELNEGLAEYTGVVISNRPKEQAVMHFEKILNAFLSNPTFVRSFAYQTLPIYGYLLKETRSNWNKEVSVKTNLTNYLINAFGLKLPVSLQNHADSLSSQYGGKEIISEETARAEKTLRLVAACKKKFIEDPHLEIGFEKMNISFDPGNLQPVEDKGTVYPNIRVTDNWGVLQVEKGALMSPNWDKISVSIPLKIQERQITGEGWILNLTGNYVVEQDENTGNYRLKKK